MVLLFPEETGKIRELNRKRVSVSLQQNKNTDPHERRSLKEFESKSNRDVLPALSSDLSQYEDFRRSKAPSQIEGNGRKCENGRLLGRQALAQG